MLISYNWLKDFVELKESPEEVGDILTLLGLEVESIEEYQSILGGLENVVVGKVLKKEKHPNADKLSLCEVNVGSDILQIVCGAPNVAAGQTVAVALPNAILYPGNEEKNKLKLKKAKIRGVVSNGMICSEYELGLGNDKSGIMLLKESIEPGTPLKEVFPVYKDVIFEIGLTPNRTDAISHLGVARDLAAKLKRKLIYPDYSSISEQGSYENPVIIEVPTEDCPYYAGVVVKNLPENYKSPRWLKDRLNAVGQKDINFYVDITNYTMLSIGQPLHAFDMDKIAGYKLIIKNADKSEDVETLDKKIRKILPGDMIIYDVEKPLVFAGIIGTRLAEVDEKTKNIFIESAYFNPVRIRKTRKRLDVQTESAFRFERGTDPNNVINGLKFYLLTLKKVFPNIEYSNFREVKKQDFPKKKVIFSFSGAERIAGVPLNRDEVINTLAALEFEITSVDADKLELKVPTYRRDVERFVDVMEEVLRVIGYNEIPEKDLIPITTKQFSEYDELYNIKNRIVQRLVGKGWQQVLNNSLVDAELSTEDSVEIANPLGKAHSILRPTLLFGGIQNIADAFNRNLNAWKIYEIGKTYHKVENNYYEKLKIAFWTASKKIYHWKYKNITYDFWTIKNVIYFLLEHLNIEVEEKVIEKHPYLAYGLELKTPYDLEIILGQIRPEIVEKYDLDIPVFYGEFNFYKYLKLLYEKRKNTIFVELPKFPATYKDISMIVPDSVNYYDIVRTIVRSKIKDIQEVLLFDVYKLSEEEYSYAIRIFFRNPNRTLTSEEVNKRLNKIIEILESNLKVRVRKQ